MAPILFLFVMQAFSETLQDKLEKRQGIKQQFHMPIPTSIEEDQGTCPPARTKSHGERHHFRNSTPPTHPPLFVRQYQESPRRRGERNMQIICSVRPQNAHRARRRQTEVPRISPSLKEDEEENLLLEPNLEPRVPVQGGFIALTDDFGHLGSIISSDLRDEPEIATRIKEATAQIRAELSAVAPLTFSSAQSFACSSQSPSMPPSEAAILGP